MRVSIVGSSADQEACSLSQRSWIKAPKPDSRAEALNIRYADQADDKADVVLLNAYDHRVRVARRVKLLAESSRTRNMLGQPAACNSIVSLDGGFLGILLLDILRLATYLCPFSGPEWERFVLFTTCGCLILPGAFLRD